jgi:hypothetical protein
MGRGCLKSPEREDQKVWSWGMWMVEAACIDGYMMGAMMGRVCEGERAWNRKRNRMFDVIRTTMNDKRSMSCDIGKGTCGEKEEKETQHVERKQYTCSCRVW